MVCSSKSYPHVLTESLFYSWVWNVPSLWHGTKLSREGHLHNWVWWLQIPGLPGKCLVGCPCFELCCGNPRFLFVACRGGNWLRAEQRASADEATSLRPGTDSDNHPFCNKQETSLPASKIEQTKTPKYEALTVGRLGFLTLLPDSLQSTCFCFCFKFHTRKHLAISL